LQAVNECFDSTIEWLHIFHKQEDPIKDPAIRRTFRDFYSASDVLLRQHKMSNSIFNAHTTLTNSISDATDTSSSSSRSEIIPQVSSSKR
jgi:hypothetical protein